MSISLSKILEKIKSVTDDNEIICAFEDVFNNECESLQMALNDVEKVRIENSLDIETVQSIINTITDEYDEKDLNQKLFLIYHDNIKIDKRILNIDAIKNTLNNIGFNIQSGHYYDYKKYVYFRTKADINRYIQKAVKYSKITKKIHEDYDGKVKTYITSVMDEILSRIRDNNQYINIKYLSNPFLECSSVSFEKQVMTIASNDMFPVIPKVYEDETIINDYKEHFKDLDLFLDFILAARFGADTKKAYLWFRAESDWGKSMLFKGILGKLKLSTEITESELKKAYSGTASGFNADMFIHSWFLFIDEFNSAVREIKNITHELSFSPKFQGQVTVPIYAKIFSSAENVRSLYNDGMVEQQYANRFIFWAESGKITDREKYVTNQIYYKKVLLSYVYQYLKTKADNYIALGEEEASNEANLVLNNIIETKKIKTSSVESVLADRIKEFKEHYTNNIDLEGYYFSDDNYVYIKNKDKFKIAFLDGFFSEAEIKIINNKELNVVLGITDAKRYSIRINGKTVSGYKWIMLQSTSPVNDILYSAERMNNDTVC